LNAKSQRSFWTANLGVAAGLVLGGLVGALLGVWMKGTLKQPVAWDLLALPVLVLIVLGTHEIGHVLGGLSQGMRFLLLIVGPFSWHASVSGIRFEWNTSLPLMGGVAATFPTKLGNSLRRQFLVMIAGGPAASLLLALCALAMTSMSNPRFAAYFLFVAVTSLGVCLVTLIPVRVGAWMNDGLQMIDLLRGGNAVTERVALLRILAQSFDGVRPRDWDSSTINELASLAYEDPLRRGGGLLYLLARAMDGRHEADISRYRALLEESVAGYPAGFRQSVHVELAIGAWLARDTNAVRRHLQASSGGIVEKSRRLLAHAALAKLEGRDEDCERDRLLATQMLAKEANNGYRKLTEDQLAMLHTGLERD